MPQKGQFGPISLLSQLHLIATPLPSECLLSAFSAPIEQLQLHLSIIVAISAPSECHFIAISSSFLPPYCRLSTPLQRHLMVDQNNQKPRRKSTGPLARPFARSLVRLHCSLIRLLRTSRFTCALRCARSLASSLTLLTPSLVGK